MIVCEFENGNKAALRHVAVDGIVLNEHDEILLVKRAAHLVHGEKWAMPGGFLDRDETVFTALRRELQEETGYEATTIDLFAVISDPNRNDDRQNISFVFLVRPGAKVGEPDDESSEMRWYALDALPDASEMAFDHLRILEMFYEHRLSRYNGPVIY